MSRRLFDATVKAEDLSIEDLRALSYVARSGTCIHSFYVTDCAGCMVRELHRILSVLVDAHDDPEYFDKQPQHGVSFDDWEGILNAARHRLEVIDNAQA